MAGAHHRCDNSDRPGPGPAAVRACHAIGIACPATLTLPQAIRMRASHDPSRVSRAGDRAPANATRGVSDGWQGSERPEAGSGDAVARFPDWVAMEPAPAEDAAAHRRRDTRTRAMTTTQALLLLGAALVCTCLGLLPPPRPSAARQSPGPAATAGIEAIACDCPGPGGRFGGPGTRR